MQGKIVKIISNLYTVSSGNELYLCRARGKFRNLGITPLVGDNVIFSDNIITEILPRKNELVRPFVSNVDQAIIIVSLVLPDLDLYLLDKLITMIEYNNVKPIICFTKIDLLTDTTEYLKIKKYYEEIGYQVFENTDGSIKNVFKDKITVVTGQSGSGKSTLLNKLNPCLKLSTNEISIALGRGKHTTRHVELIDMFSGLIADTPGFSSLSLKSIPKNDIKYTFVEFNKYMHDCEYKDCNHDLEVNCNIKNLVGTKILKSRYDNYIKFLRGD